ncbi:MAG TPA: trypsin-like peptidase domain-containing protein [Candidatus Acidoferrum sp.]|nr:trypsin-like peptidase domain-containing protein [Candidatus Methylomirabilis sp.]HWU39079.1 trypsin-like peptidase domain-containing protein [Candidatus Acidoferrum sp.]
MRSVAVLGFLLVLLTLPVDLVAARAETQGDSDGVVCADPIPTIYERVSPAVVSIVSMAINPYQPGDRVNRAVGSGVILDSSGLVLTNSHVVFGRQAITVTLDDGNVVTGEMVGSDPVFDVALLRIPRPSTGTLPVAVPGSSARLRVGEEVLALGNPLGLDQTLTRGIVSAINRILPDTPFSVFEPLIQTDAPINPGNSGGPLLNRCGEVIGLTTAIMPEAQNISFAIPIDLVRSILPSLLEKGRVVRPWLGVQGHLVPPSLKEIVRLPLAEGLLVEVVEPGSPAEHVGVQGGRLDIVIGGDALLLGGDIITHVNGRLVDTPERLTKTMRGLKVGDTVRLTLFREGKSQEVEFVLPERPFVPQDVLTHRSISPLGTIRPPVKPGYRL